MDARQAQQFQPLDSTEADLEAAQPTETIQIISDMSQLQQVQQLQQLQGIEGEAIDPQEGQISVSQIQIGKLQIYFDPVPDCSMEKMAQTLNKMVLRYLHLK